MEDQRKTLLITAVVLVVVLIGAGLLYWYFPQPSPPAPAAVQPKFQEPAPPSSSAQIKPAGEKEPLPGDPVKLPGLDSSDDFVRPVIRGLSPHGKLGDLLKIKNILRVITAAVDDLSRGKSPRAHLGFLFYGQVFPVTDKGGKIYLNPKGYDRYDLLTDAFVSLNTARTVQAYEKLKPLFQEAYRDLGYPQEDFHPTLIRAMQRVLGAPVLEGEVLLKEEGKGVNFSFLDEGLENMDEARKHLLRMGPKNTRKIQQKLRGLALALGVPETQLPQPKTYVPRKG